MNFQKFRNEVLGRAYNLDGAYGAQCWDGYALYMQKLGYSYANCTSSGYVKDIWNNRASNGMLDNCIEVSVMQQGDITVFKNHPWTPDSHIAIFVQDLGNGYGLFLGQNQGAYGGAFNEVKLPYEATFETAFRPKCFVAENVVVPEQSKHVVDQILEPGSKVEFAGCLKVESYADGLVYNSRIGGNVSADICYEDSASDGAQDQYFATTNATFTIQGTYTVGEVAQRGGVWDAYINELGFWVHCDALIEVE